jgi:hypothetical protein
VTITATNLLLLTAVVSVWALGSYLQWRNIRHQERILAKLMRLRFRVSRKAAREKAPRLETPSRAEEQMRHPPVPRAG